MVHMQICIHNFNQRLKMSWCVKFLRKIQETMCSGRAELGGWATQSPRFTVRISSFLVSPVIVVFQCSEKRTTNKCV